MEREHEVAAFDDGDGVCAAHAVDDLAEVFIGRAHDDGDAVTRGFQRIVAAFGDEAAADEGDRAELVDGAEAADLIEQDDLAALERLGAFDPLADADGGLADLAGDGLEALRVAGRDEEDSVVAGFHEAHPGVEDGDLFAFEGAAADDDFNVGGKVLAEGFDDGVVGGEWGVVFEVADDANAAEGHADFGEAAGGLVPLREEEGDLVEDGFPEEAELEGARIGAVGDAGVDDDDGDAGAFAFGEHAGPELAFHEDDEFGPKDAEVAEHGVGEVQGHVEDGDAGEPLVGERLAGEGGGGDGDEPAGQCDFEFGDEELGGEELADGDGVEPDDVVSFGGADERGGDFAEAATQAGAIAAADRHSPKPPGRAHEESQRQEEAVNCHSHALCFNPTKVGRFTVGFKQDDNQRRMIAMRKVAWGSGLATLLLLSGVGKASDKPRPAPPVNPASQYTLNEAHPAEKVTIAAEPCIDAKACPFFRLPYVSHGFVPVRVIVTNDRDDALNLDDVRIQFIPAEGDKEGAATDEDLNRRLFATKSTMGTRIPVIGITTHPEPVDKKILNDDADFGFASTIVPPHSTRAGYVFYDVRGIDDPVLKGAELYVKEIKYVDAKNVKHELFAFSLFFDKWLEAQAKPEAKKPDAAAAK